MGRPSVVRMIDPVASNDRLANLPRFPSSQRSLQHAEVFRHHLWVRRTCPHASLRRLPLGSKKHWEPARTFLPRTMDFHFVSLSGLSVCSIVGSASIGTHGRTHQGRRHTCRLDEMYKHSVCPGCWTYIQSPSSGDWEGPNPLGDLNMCKYFCTSHVYATDICFIFSHIYIYMFILCL